MYRRSRCCSATLSASRLTTIAQIEGLVRSAGSERVLACDMRFAARESAVFAQFESAFGQIPGGGATQHLTRLMGRPPLECPAPATMTPTSPSGTAGSIERCRPAARRLRRRARPPRRGFAGWAAIKDHVYDTITLAPIDDFRRDSDLFAAEVQNPETQRRYQNALSGLQTREAEMQVAPMLSDLGDNASSS